MNAAIDSNFLEIAIAAVALVSTFIISVFGLIVAFLFSSNYRRRFLKIEREVNLLADDKKAVYGLRNLSTLLLEYQMIAYSVIDTQRRFLEDLSRDLEDISLAKPVDSKRAEHRRDVFRGRIAPKLEELSRMNLLISVIRAEDAEELGQAVGDLVERYRDYRTIDQLELVQKLSNTEERAVLTRAAARLEKELRGPYDSRRWTG